MTGTVLVVDDDPVVLDMLKDVLEREHHTVDATASAEAALELLSGNAYDAAVVDLALPGMGGMDLIRRIKEDQSEVEIVVFTGTASVESAIDALESEVFAYMTKPANVTMLNNSVTRAVERRRLIRQNRALMEELRRERDNLRRQVTSAKKALEDRLYTSDLLVGDSEAMRRVRHQIADVAPTDLAVLVRGETGTGKDVVCRVIHGLSGRETSGDFVKVSCPTIPEGQVEAELFGEESEEQPPRPGRFELAANGTLFLDEVSLIPAGVQPRLLHAIEDKEFARVGGRERHTSDFRLLAATNEPIEERLSRGTFRTDLFYRLNQFPITLPPLRDRPEDIPELARHFVELFEEVRPAKGRDIPKHAMKTLMAHHWPGNVRELKTVVERFALTGDLEALRVGEQKVMPPVNGDAPLPERLNDAEANTILEALNQSRWNRRKAAKILGISYGSLRHRIEKYGLDRQYATE